jgi:hypothetical protein
MATFYVRAAASAAAAAAFCLAPTPGHGQAPVTDIQPRAAQAVVDSSALIVIDFPAGSLTGSLSLLAARTGLSF